jgi:ribulose-bisphosphate carboxylase large chain
MKVNYIDLKYKPSKKDVICEFSLEPSKGTTFQKAASNVALESSIGTWTELSTMGKRVIKTLKPSVYYMNKKTNTIRVAYPNELFEPGNMSQILSSIAGNIFGMKSIKNLRLEDIQFPKKLVDSFKGPMFGIQGVRKLTRVKHRPLVGTIVKPKLGLNEKEHARVAYDAWSGGLDVVKDDENLTSMSFNKFRKRVDETVKLKFKAEKETGEKKIYMANITAETDEMKKRMDYLKKAGNEYFMIDVLTTGWAAVHTMRNYNDKKKLVMHAHRALHGALTRNPKHGISMLALAKTYRLLGVDQLHIGTAAVGKMHGSASEELNIEAEIEDHHVNAKPTLHSLQQDWYNKKPVFAVASGGLQPGMTQKLLKVMGKNIIAQYGGGCHGHPDGTYAGAKAIRQSAEASMKGIPLTQYAKTHEELNKAIKLWGVPK